MSFLIGVPNSVSKLNGSYIREGWQNGMALQEARGYNPYKMGVVGASDSHNTVIPYSQANNFGSHGHTDGSPQERLAGKVESGMAILQTSVSGLGGAWAEENTRESIFAAMQRKEVFGTSGVRIKVRLFGGWSFEELKLLGRFESDKTWIKQGYAKGVPMGGDLPQTDSHKAPSFVVWAVKDPDDANLDRIQIIKGWTKSGQIFEKVYDVVWSGDRKPDSATGKVPPVGSTVDISKATYKNSIGATELKKVWTDPDFDPSLHAFYYARVLQIPTPRWSTYDAAKLGVAPPKEVAATVQERVWTTPIWFTPKPEATKAAKRSVTVADLKGAGATVLGDAELKALVVDKPLKVRNTVTGQQFEILYNSDGQRVITSVDGCRQRPRMSSPCCTAANSACPPNTRSRMGRSSRLWAGSRLKSLFTNPATNTWPRAAASSASRITKWKQRSKTPFHLGQRRHENTSGCSRWVCCSISTRPPRTSLPQRLA
jgi:hypothetical protein